MLCKQFSVNGLMVAHSPEMAVRRAVRLPVGGTYRKGRILGAITSVTARSEVRTWTITGTPTGFTGSFTFTNGGSAVIGTLANLVTTVPTAAEVTTALEAIFGAGNVTVSKSVLVYTITFANTLANVRIADNLTASLTYTAGTSPAQSFALTTRGSSGEGQYDIYDDTASDGTQVAKCVLEYDYLSDPQGGKVTEQGPTGQPFSPDAYFSGYFFVADLLGLDAAAVTDLGKMSEGTVFSAPNGILHIF